MVHIATVIVAVLASTAVAATSNDKRIVVRNADNSIAVSRSGDVYVCSRNAGPCGGTDVVCPPPSKRDCAAVLGARDDARMIAVAARCDGGNCKHPSS